ncbi:MAG: carboxypeptidase-like regulatory domain-containing protein [Planctomycetota bacterium]|nr:carboxypeptidase-like regulatory domain-containing protein [Planctomycetota bacterium]MDA1214712.1 carboxypeptidase-like regulatory domain-containing protein [Planctomycetota bacterium]
MYAMSCVRGISVGLCLMGMICGCGESVDAPEIFEVKGTVTLDSQPLANVKVSFVPVEKEGRGAFGKTDASGNYSLTTMKPNDGALPGEYKVLVLPDTADDGVAGYDPTKDIDSKGTAGEGTAKIPEAYRSLEKTTLKATVTTSPNSIPLELKSGK